MFPPPFPFLRQELDSSLGEASALRERFREAESRFNDAAKDAAGVAETTREELTLMSEQRRAFVEREGELQRLVEGLQEVIMVAAMRVEPAEQCRACYHTEVNTVLYCKYITTITSIHANTVLCLYCYTQEAAAAAIKHKEALEEAQAGGLQNLQSEKVIEEA